MRIGAHVSASGGVDMTISRAVDIGAEAIQFFPSPNRTRQFKPIDEKTAANFKDLSLRYSIGPNVFHAIYMVNLANPDPEISRKSIQSLVNYMHTASDLGVMGVIFHLNSHKGHGFKAVFRNLIENINRVLDNSPNDTKLIIENSAGMGDHIGSKFSEIGEILNAVNDSRMAVCIDTQHSFAAGYDIRSPRGVIEMVKEFESEIGLSYLSAVHLNDSKRDLGEAVDRHENIGEGYLGLDAFKAILSSDAFLNVPIFLEVPGFSGDGPDAKNIEIVKKIRATV